MKLGYTKFDGTADAEYVRVALTPQDEVKLIPGKKIVPVLRFRKEKKQPDKPNFISKDELHDWIAKLAAYEFEYVFVGSEMNDPSQWAGTPDQYFELLEDVGLIWLQHDDRTQVCDGGLQGTAIVKNKVQHWTEMWTHTDRANFHHFQELETIPKILDYIRDHTSQPIVCSAAGVKKSIGKKVTMTAKIKEMQRLGVELLIWFSGDGDDDNTNLWTLPKHLKEFNAVSAELRSHL